MVLIQNPDMPLLETPHANLTSEGDEICKMSLLDSHLLLHRKHVHSCFAWHPPPRHSRITLDRDTVVKDYWDNGRWRLALRHSLTAEREHVTNIQLI